MEDARYIITRIDQARARERQFQADIDRLRFENPPNRGLISQKEGYLAEVRREIRSLESKLK